MRLKPVIARHRVDLIAGIGLLIATLCQQPGKLVFDTKLYVATDPTGFLSSATRLLDLSHGFAEVPNQSIGYLFPMGSWFLVTDAVGLPTWIAQRVWLAVVLLVAFAGMRRLAHEVIDDASIGATIAGATYACGAGSLAIAGSGSGTYLPVALAPWLLLTAIKTSTKRIRLGSGTLRYALVVLLMGGINATSVLAAMVPTWLFLIYALETRRFFSFAWRLSIATFAATAWWALPLAMQRGYGLNFLTYTEHADITASSSSLSEVLRGASYWLNRLLADDAWVRTGWALTHNWFYVAISVVVAGVGLAGLANHRLRYRGFLLTCLLTGTAIMVCGFAGSGSGDFAQLARDLLDGPASALRNVHKFDPLVRIPLALGLAQVATSLSKIAPPSRRSITAIGWLGLVIALMIPFAGQTVLSAGGFKKFPDEYRQLANELKTDRQSGWTLQLPAASFAEQSWGRPIDDPLRALGVDQLVTRDIIPLGANGSLQVLDQIESMFERADPDLGAYLARAGVSQVVLRTDLKLGDGPASDPQKNRANLIAGGLISTKRLSTLELFSVRNPQMAIVKDAKASISTTGSVASVNEFSTWAGPIFTQPDAVALDHQAPSDLFHNGVQVISDDLPLRGLNAGSARPTRSWVLWNPKELGGALVADRVNSNQTQGRPQINTRSQTLLANLTSSIPFGIVASSPEHGPRAAFDGSNDSTWRAPGEGSSLHFEFNQPQSLRRVRLELGRGVTLGQINSVTIRTDKQTLTRAPLPEANEILFDLDDSPTREVVLELERVTLSAQNKGLDIAEVSFQTPTQTYTGSSWPLSLDQPSSEANPEGGQQIDRFSGIGTVIALHRLDQSQAFVDGQAEEIGDVVRQVSLSNEFITSGARVEFQQTEAPPGQTRSALALDEPITCSDGVGVMFDGVTIPVKTAGKDGELCGLPPALKAGEHTISFVTKPGYGPYRPVVASIILMDQAASRYNSQSAPLSLNLPMHKSRSAIEVHLPASDRSTLVELPINYSSGFSAHVDKGALTESSAHLLTTRSDAWKQAVIVPAHAETTLRVEFAPQRNFDRTLALGAVMAIALLFLSLWELFASRKNFDQGLPDNNDQIATPRSSGDSTATSERRVLLTLATVALFWAANPIWAATSLTLCFLLGISRRISTHALGVGVIVGLGAWGVIVLSAVPAQPSSNRGAFSCAATVLLSLILGSIAASSLRKMPSKSPAEDEVFPDHECLSKGVSWK